MLPNPAERPFLNADELVEIMPLSRASIYQGIKQGDIPSIRVGRRILVPTAALLRLLALDPEVSHTVVGSAAESNTTEPGPDRPPVGSSE